MFIQVTGTTRYKKPGEINIVIESTSKWVRSSDGRLISPHAKNNGYFLEEENEEYLWEEPQFNASICETFGDTPIPTIDNFWIDGPHICEAPADLINKAVGAPRLPGF